jgi:hypothetical protein
MDRLATEKRKQPRLNEIAAFYGFSDWHELVGWHIQDYWTRYLVTSRDGSLSHFAQTVGYPDWVSLRDAIMSSYGTWADRVKRLNAMVREIETWQPPVALESTLSYSGP